MDTGRFTDFSLACLGFDPPEGWRWRAAKNYDCANGCNWLAQTFEGEYLMLMGDDHSFQPDLVQQLLRHKVDIVAPLVLGRRAPFEPVCFRDGKPWEPDGPPGLYEVDETGSAGMLIHRRVFEALEFPYFRQGHGDAGYTSDDVYFCRKAKEAGFSIHVDTSVALSHFAVLEIAPLHDEDGWKTQLSVGGREVVCIQREQR